MQRVLILGSGIAGLCCAKLLARQGCEVHLQGSLSVTAPIWVLNAVTCSLLADIWQLNPDAFWQGGYFLGDRQVCWGPSSDLERVYQPSIVVRGDQVAAHLQSYLLKDHLDLVHIHPNPWEILEEDFDWTLDSTGRTAALTPPLVVRVRHLCGHRCMISQEVLLNPTAPSSSCWVETVADGWLFLAPLSATQAVLQAMVPAQVVNSHLTLTSLLNQTRFIKPQIQKLLGKISIFAASPQYSDPFCGPGWLAVGDAAFSVDPMSGDGIGYTIRSAILATSILNSSASGFPIQDCLQHYSLRLRQTFVAHLRYCLQYYSAFFTSSVWQAEIKQMHQELDTLIDSGFQPEQYRYRLQQFSLASTLVD
jgi:NAD(P)-binding Rossmann-like domain